MLLVLVLAAVTVSAVAEAQVSVDRPLVSVSRLSTAVGVNYVWYSGMGEESVPAFGKEFEVGFYAAYNLTSSPMPHLSLIGSSEYPLDTKVLKTRIGLRLGLFAGGE